MATAQPAAYTAPTLKDNVGGAHTTVVSLGVMLLVLIILVELAGTSHSAAVGVGFLLLSVIAVAGITHSGNLKSLSQYPAVPQ